MNTAVQISYNVSQPKSDASAYKTFYSATADPEHDLRQIGTVWNDVVRYRGVYASHDAARRAATAYLRGA